MSLVDLKFECEYCGQRYKQETSFLKHECKEKKRLDEFKTPKGQLAFLLYKRWILKSKHGRVGEVTFLTSNYYRTFIKIADFVISVDIADTMLFVDYMVGKKLRPHIWCMGNTYLEYLRHLDNKESPMKMIDISVKTILKECDIEEIDPGEFFDTVEPHHFIHLLESRKLSPWLLFISGKFRKFYKDKLNLDQRIIVNSFINAEKWALRFQKHPSIVKKVKVYVKELDL